MPIFKNRFKVTNMVFGLPNNMYPTMVLMDYPLNALTWVRLSVRLSLTFSCERDTVHSFYPIVLKFAQYVYIHESTEPIENEQILIIRSRIISPFPLNFEENDNLSLWTRYSPQFSSDSFQICSVCLYPWELRTYWKWANSDNSFQNYLPFSLKFKE